MWRQIASNRRKSVVLVFLMTAMLVAVGSAASFYYFGDYGIIGGVAALAIAIVMAAASYYSGDKIFLSISGAKKIGHDDFPELFNVVEEMKIASGFSRMPDVYVIYDPSPNAFATGRKPESASIAVTTGLLERVNREELQGVVAHEMAHIVNRDVLLIMMLGILLGVVAMISDGFFRSMRFGSGGTRRRSSSGGGGQLAIIMLVVSIILLILAPIMTQLIYFAISRKREYLADACGVQFTRYPTGLADALEKIAATPQQVRRANRVTSPMYIVNPLAGKKKLSDLTSTHPPALERIRILRAMAGEHSFESYQAAYQAAGTRSSGRKLFSTEDMKKNWFSSAKPVGIMDVPAMPAAAQAPIADRSRINDVLWKKEGYAMIDCECGVRLKAPPKYHASMIQCPKCKREYEVNAAV
ncbi:MAG TPA: M48 family metallopeptidase [bacterium]|nr:MAG: hypothetical protein BWY28_01792 [bacterium ADurb.Bin236]HPI77229.1 M48 family metallopeptidase [bacterium]HPN95730.1 M48 family metallopeptidase [bacterium]